MSRSNTRVIEHESDAYKNLKRILEPQSKVCEVYENQEKLHFAWSLLMRYLCDDLTGEVLSFIRVKSCTYTDPFTFKFEIPEFSMAKTCDFMALKKGATCIGGYADIVLGVFSDKESVIVESIEGKIVRLLPPIKCNPIGEVPSKIFYHPFTFPICYYNKRIYWSHAPFKCSHEVDVVTLFIKNNKYLCDKDIYSADMSEVFY